MRAKETEAEPIVSPVPKKRTDEKRDTADETSEEVAKRDMCGMASTCTSAMTDGEIGTDTKDTVCADLAENGTPYNENVASGLKLWPEAQRCVKDWLMETTEEAS